MYAIILHIFSYCSNTIYKNGNLTVYVEESQNGKIEWKSGNEINILIYTVGDLCGNGELIKFFAEYRGKLRTGRKSIKATPRI